MPRRRPSELAVTPPTRPTRRAAQPQFVVEAPTPPIQDPTPAQTMATPQAQRDQSSLLLSTPSMPNHPHARPTPPAAAAATPPNPFVTNPPRPQQPTIPRPVVPPSINQQPTTTSAANTGAASSPATTTASSLPPSPSTISDPPPPPNTRDISTLATWTLSSHKPGCGIPALRHPSPTHFWQSDGPQPHTLTLHFFKRVAIVAVRVYLDIEADESYTPTKMVFLAGMSEGGLVEFGGWEYVGDGQNAVGPRGWVSVDLSGVGGREGGGYGGYSDDEDVEDGNSVMDITGKGGRKKRDDGGVVGGGDDVLKCMVLQVRITENHQNGKDTHVRGFQVFARDERRKGTAGAAGGGKRKSAGTGKRKIGDNAMQEQGKMEMEGQGGEGGRFELLEEPDWMGDPELR